MTFENLLIHSCSIERFTDGAQDKYGQPVKTWNALHSNIECRHVYGKGTEVKVGQEVIIIYDQIIIENLDVTTQDRVSCDGAYWNIVDIAFRSDGIGEHHKTLFVQRAK